MQKQTKNDLRINGVGKSAGGSFDRVQINGKVEINGNVDCNDFQLNGLGTIKGNVKAETFQVSGKSDVHGNLECDKVTIDGKIDIKGDVSVTRIENNGMLGISGELSSESFRSHGGFNIGGLLNSGQIDILIYAPCSAKEIGGEEIEIRAGSKFALSTFIGSIFPGKFFKTDTLEGDNIYLEDTIAKTVRGQNVKIGPGCQIDLVEYKNTFQKGQQSDIKVKESRKI